MSQVFAHTFKDFTGGLNLAADQANIEANESPRMLNVEPLAAGGFGPRKSVQKMHTTALGSQPKSIWTYENGSTKHVMVSYGTKLAYSTGGDFTDVSAITQTTGLRHSAASLIGKVYIVNGTDQAVSWDGTTGTRLTVTGFNDDLTAPAGGKFPQSRYVAVFAGRMWCAYTVESGTTYKNRIRFSHPVSVDNTKGPEDWRTNDYIDIDVGKDGDEIVGMTTVAERLIVIKRSGLYAVSGFDQNTFQVFPISNTVGACGPDAFVVDEEGLHVFNWPLGIFTLHLNGKLEYRWEKLERAIRDASIPAAYMDKISLGSSHGRLHVAVPWLTATTADHVFLYDRTVGKRGCWSFHQIDAGPMVEWAPQAVVEQLLAIDSSTGTGRGLRVQKLNQDRFAEDNYISSSLDRLCEYQTSWHDLGEPSLPKRWKRAVVLLRDRQHVRLLFSWFRNFDTTDARPFDVEIVQTSGTTLIWGTGLWGTNTWGSTLVIKDTSFKTSPPGRANAVSLYFQGPDQSLSIEWEVHSVTLKYVPKKVR